MKNYHLELVPVRKSGPMLLILSVRVFWFHFQNCMWSTFRTGHPQLQSPVLKDLCTLKSSFVMTLWIATPEVESCYIQSCFLQCKKVQYSCNFWLTGSELKVKQWKPFCKLASKSMLRHPLFLILPKSSSAAEDGKCAFFISYCYACKLKLLLKFLSWKIIQGLSGSKHISLTRVNFPLVSF